MVPSGQVAGQADLINFGYFVLGRVIEKISGQSYEQYVQQNVLANCGVMDMRIGGNTRAERAPGEAVHYNGDHTHPYAFDIRRMDSCGGWIATPSDLVRFAMDVDGFSYTPGILQESSIRAMTELCPISPADEHYARGWRVNAGNWWYNGSCPGASAVLGRTPNGICAAGLANLRTEEMRKSMDLLMGVSPNPAHREHISRRGLPASIPRTYVKLLRDQALPAEWQDKAAANIDAKVVTLDSGHMAPLTHPKDLGNLCIGRNGATV
jgi:CubicO group peptidase (beta-lactamase class C family)